MNNDDRVDPSAVMPGNPDDDDLDAEQADETLPRPSPADDEPEADELTRKIDEIERKVADGN